MKRRDLRVIRGRAKFRFSLGELVDALQGAGVLTDEAIRLAHETEKHYRNKEQSNIELTELIELLAKKIEERVAPEVALRFREQIPPFVPLLVEREGGVEEFSKRELSTSLEKFELGFKEAYAVAKQVEQRIRTEGREVLPQQALVHLVAQVLEGRYGREMRLRYEGSQGLSSDLMVIEEDGLFLPYSRGVLSRSLMLTGLGLELSYTIARRIEDRLWQRGDPRIERSSLRQEVVQLLLAEAGEEFARRYELLQSVRHSDRPIVILIGGAPGVGKSRLASELGYRLGIPRIVSSDSVRQALRSLISAELSPTLHSSSYAAWRAGLLPSEQQAVRAKPKRVARGFLAQVQQLGTALAAIIDRNIQEATSLVMEGVHLIPGISPSADFEGATIIEMILAVENEESHRNHFGLREGQTRNRRSREVYLDHFQEIRMLQSFIIRHAREEGVVVIESEDLDQAVDRAIEHILDMLLVAYYREDGSPVRRESQEIAEAS